MLPFPEAEKISVSEMRQLGSLAYSVHLNPGAAVGRQKPDLYVIIGINGKKNAKPYRMVAKGRALTQRTRCVTTALISAIVQK